MPFPSILISILISSVLSSRDGHSCESNYTATLTAMPSTTLSDTSSKPTKASVLRLGRKNELEYSSPKQVIQAEGSRPLIDSVEPPSENVSPPEPNLVSQVELPVVDYVQLSNTADEPTSTDISIEDTVSASSTATSLPHLYGYSIKGAPDEKNSAARFDTIFISTMLAVLCFTLF